MNLIWTSSIKKDFCCIFGHQLIGRSIDSIMIVMIDFMKVNTANDDASMPAKIEAAFWRTIMTKGYRVWEWSRNQCGCFPWHV